MPSVRGGRWLDDLGQDVRYAVRTLGLSHRAFAATGVLTLAVGIGATTAVFSVVSGLLLRPLPFAEPDRLVQLHGTTSVRRRSITPSRRTGRTSPSSG